MLRNSSQDYIEQNASYNLKKEYADTRYEDHKNILSKITNNLKSSRYNKENNNLDFSSEIIIESESGRLRQSSSIVDLRNRDFNDISMNQLSPIRDEYSANEVDSTLKVKASKN